MSVRHKIPWLTHGAVWTLYCPLHGGGCLEGLQVVLEHQVPSWTCQ